MNTQRLSIASLRQISGEGYADYCQRLEKAVIRMVNSEDVSEGSLKLLAFVLMEAPSDFDEVSREKPFQKSRRFLSRQGEEIQALFRKQCQKLPCKNVPRVNALLGIRNSA